MADNDDLTAQWLPHVEAWEQSGQSQSAYCREHNLVKSRFTYWKLKLRPTTSRHQANSMSGFVPVRARGKAASGLTLRLPNGIAVEGICGDNLQLAQELAGTWL
jgi:transposase